MDGVSLIMFGLGLAAGAGGVCLWCLVALGRAAKGSTRATWKVGCDGRGMLFLQTRKGPAATGQRFGAVPSRDVGGECETCAQVRADLEPKPEIGLCRVPAPRRF